MKFSTTCAGVLFLAGGLNTAILGQPGGFGRGGGPMQQEIKVLEKYDKDGNGWLNAEERKAAREYLSTLPRRGPGMRGGRGGFGPPPGFPPGGPPPDFGPGGPPPFPPGGMMPGGNANTPVQPGKKVSPAEVKTYANEPLYDPKTLRTLFLEFENPDWERELADFYGTDVDVPARLTVDGKTYTGVGVHFRGMSSYMMVPEGRKRSLNLSLDLVNGKQRLGGYRTLNLLNANGDPTFLRGVLYLDIARNYIPAPKANFKKVVINGENWGVYQSVQQFNSDFIKEWFGTTDGARWKSSGSPGGGGGLGYLGDDPAPYKRLYEIKSKDNEKSWAALINLCKVLNQTPPDKLEEALAPVLDIEGALKFLALDKALLNSDGYWIRNSDFNIYMDPKGKFHIIPHDVNESMREPDGPGRFRGGGESNGLAVDPFAGADDPSKPLLNKLLAVPALRTRYLSYMRDIAEKWLDWNRLGKLAREYQSLIAADVAADTRKLYPTEAFSAGVDGMNTEPGGGGFRGPAGPAAVSLKQFAEGRRKYLLSHPEVAKAPPLK